MALKEELEKQGNWLFRWRSYLPLIIVGLFPYVIFFHTPHIQNSMHEAWSLVCLGISYIGLIIRIMTLGYVPKGTSGRNTKRQVADRLNTTGMYSLVRHPLYLGNYIIVLGIILFTMSLWFVLVISLFFWIYYERIMIAEEEFLRNKFGKVYTDWAQITPAFIPAFRSWKTPDLPFSVTFVIKREYTGFFGIAVFFSFIELLYQLSENHMFMIPSGWLLLLASSTALYILVLLIKKKTNLLVSANR